MRLVGVRRRFWFALAFTIGYSMVLTPFETRWPL